MSYYQGDLDKDLSSLESEPNQAAIDDLNTIGKCIGFGRAQQILQILWAKELRNKGLPTIGALGPKSN